MQTVKRDLDRYRRLLGTKIRERGYTYLEVEDALGWCKSYISQLVHGYRKMRLEQVYLVLNVIGVEPEEFFGELYPLPLALPPEPPPHPSEDAAGKLAALAGDVRAVARSLIDQGVIEAQELADAVDAADLYAGSWCEIWEDLEATTTTHTPESKGGRR